MRVYDRRKFLKMLGFSAFILGVGIPNRFFKTDSEGIDWLQNISQGGNSPLKYSSQLNVKGFAYDYHTSKIIQNAKIRITASKIRVVDNKLIKDSSGCLVKERLQMSVYLNKDGSYKIPISKGLFQINVDGSNKFKHEYNCNNYFVVLNNQDATLDIELARSDIVKRIENERNNYCEGRVTT